MTTQMTINEATSHTDVVCPPNPDAVCACGETFQFHIAADNPDAPVTLGNAGCPHDADAAFWKARPIRQFELADGDSLDCDGATTCTVCDVDVCAEHSDDTTRCVDGGLHHNDCTDQCQPCLGAHADDLAEDRAIEAWKGDWA